MRGPIRLAGSIVIALSIIGCSRVMGPMHLGTLGPGVEALAVMRLRPNVEEVACERWLLGISLGPNDVAGGDPVAQAVGRLLSLEPEANILSEASVRWERFSVGVYERQCIRVRGVLGRTIRTVTLPSGAHPHAHH